MPQDKDPPRGRQLPHWLFLSPEEREKSPIWRVLRGMGESVARLRDRLPRYTPEQIERWQALVRQLPDRVVKLGQEWREGWQEQAEAARASEQAPNDPIEQSLESVEQPVRPGRPRIDPPHLDAALNDMGIKWHRARSSHAPITKRHIGFVGDYCRNHGDEIGRIYDPSGGVIDEALEKTIRRRIEEWKRKLPT